jgi:hypothetical protein
LSVGRTHVLGTCCTLQEMAGWRPGNDEES